MKSVPEAGLGPPQEPTRRRVGRRWLVNAVNRANFHDTQVLLTFRHAANGSLLNVPAWPGPCVGSRVECRWVRKPPVSKDPSAWELLHFQLLDGLAQYEVRAEDASWDGRSACFTLPESAVDVSKRRTTRHACRGVRAWITWRGSSLEGTLVSSSADSFSLRLKPGATAPASGELAEVSLSRGLTTIFSGRCVVIRSADGRGGPTVALRLHVSSAPKDPPTRQRCLRPRIAPLPLIVFRHPLSGRQLTLRALDIAGAGFSVEEEASRAQLLPGLLLPRVRIELTSGFEFPCSARVVYSEPTPGGGLRSGLAIESMSLRDHTRLTSLLHLGEYRNTSVCTPHVDLEELWSFFFESGFIYPEKYAYLKDQKAQFLKLYRNLYTRAPRIARHVIYQERGAIHGHVSMFRWLPVTWILHHHAALTSTRHKAGLVVMEQMLRYIQEFHRLFPQLMRYIACYFRPNNRFAARTFGDASRSLRDRRRSSLDSFAYYHLPSESAAGPLTPGWALDDAGPADLRALSESYERDGGGLMLEGLALREEDHEPEAALSREYARLGFRRERRLYALRRDGRCVVLVAANVSDVGLNLSDLTNGLQAFVVEPALLAPGLLADALASLAGIYPPGSTNVLLYPRSYAEAHGMAFDKAYDLGVLGLAHLGPYLHYIEQLITRSRTASADKVAEELAEFCR